MPKKATARSSKPKGREVDGMIAWEDLTAEEKAGFQTDFLAYNAHAERQKIVQKRERGYDFQLNSLLGSYEELSLLRWRAISNAPEELRAEMEAQNVQIDAKLGELRQEILDLLWTHIRLGGWSALRWLADYGIANHPSGLFDSRHIQCEAFPSPKARIAIVPKDGSQFAEAMLRCFFIATGCDVRFLHESGYLPGESANTRLPLRETARMILLGTLRHLPPELIPKRLPTKNYLYALTLRAFKSQMNTSTQSYLRRTLKQLGLSGLPDGSRRSPQRLDEKTLSPEALALREEMWRSTGL